MPARTIFASLLTADRRELPGSVATQAGSPERAGNRPRMRPKDRGPARRGPPPPGACPSRYPGCPMRIAYVVGARPNFVKMAPVISDRS
jgi:hypothetical protein